MGLLSRVSCLFGRHQRNGAKVVKRGSVYSAPCIHCGKRLEKYRREDSWKPI